MKGTLFGKVCFVACVMVKCVIEQILWHQHPGCFEFSKKHSTLIFLWSFFAN